MLNKVKHLYTDSSLTLRMTGSVNIGKCNAYNVIDDCHVASAPRNDGRGYSCISFPQNKLQRRYMD